MTNIVWAIAIALCVSQEFVVSLVFLANKPGNGNKYWEFASKSNDYQIISNKDKDYIVLQRIGNWQCQRSNGLEPHPVVCSQFVNCVEGSGVVQQCGPGTVFNKDLNVCDWPYNVDCTRSSPSTIGEYNLDNSLPTSINPWSVTKREKHTYETDSNPIKFEQIDQSTENSYVQDNSQSNLSSAFLNPPSFNQLRTITPAELDLSLRILDDYIIESLRRDENIPSKTLFQSPVASVPIKCDASQWLCENSAKCVQLTYLCDGVLDCSDNSDENQSKCELPLQFRLSSDAAATDNAQGLAEVRYKGVWGTVCNDGIGENEAIVFCRSIGFHGTASISLQRKLSSDSVGPLWLDQVRCRGDELSVDKCLHNFGNTNCDHRDDAVIQCSNHSSRKKYLEPSSEEIISSNSTDKSTTTSFPQHCGKILVQENSNRNTIHELPTYRILASNVAKRGQHPWQASIRVKGNSILSRHECGATVITERHVITAAHCVTNYELPYYMVRIGDHLTDTVEDHEIDALIQRMHIHHDFHYGRISDNDIAIVELKHSIEFNEMVQPICFPSAGVSYRDGQLCTISGWGSILTGSAGSSKELRSAEVPIISDAICKQEKVYGTNVTDNMFCAGFLEGNSADACGGDSGGPLICEEEGTHMLYGIISWGIRCGEANRPGVYVKVANYVEWIKKIIRSGNI